MIKSPFLNIINHYTLYDALCEKSIVNPKIIWFTKEDDLSQQDIMIEVKNLIKNLYYKKIIVWCGLINICNQLYELWREYFSDYTVCIDTSQSLNENNFEKFKNIQEKGILFCAAKHREGSDIQNLDACIFMDKVQKRSAKTFLQCVGRVLRLQKNKDHGLIIDIKAKNAYDIIKRMALYLNNDKTFPYTYNYQYNHDQKIKINNLLIQILLSVICAILATGLFYGIGLTWNDNYQNRLYLGLLLLVPVFSYIIIKVTENIFDCYLDKLRSNFIVLPISQKIQSEG